MQKNKKIILVATIAVLAVALLFFYVKNNYNVITANPDGQTEQPGPTETGEIILFYGQECPHCQDLEEWIESNRIKEKVSFQELEVYHNEENLNLLAEKARFCELDENAIGIPFLWTGSGCLVGTDFIQQFFQNNISNQENTSENSQTNEVNE